MKRMEGFKTYRHKNNPKEKEIHDEFVKNYSGENMSMIIFPPTNNGLQPSEFLTDREEKIVISTIQWLGTPVGQKFLEDCGFKLEK